MTIPTREEALEACAWLKERYLYSSDPTLLFVEALRSYIESHTGEPVAWQYLLENGRWSNMPGDWTTDEDALGRYTYRPLFASPVQPVKLEWVGTDGNNLSYNGKVIAAIDYSKNNGGFYVMTWLDEHFRKSLTCATYGPLEEARAALMSTARQWLSGGGK